VEGGGVGELPDLIRVGETKSSIVILRVAEAEKEEIRAVADALGMTVAGYLLALHREVRDRIR
jgi:hypothetical protein